MESCAYAGRLFCGEKKMLQRLNLDVYRPCNNNTHRKLFGQMFSNTTFLLDCLRKIDITSRLQALVGQYAWKG